MSSITPTVAPTTPEVRTAAEWSQQFDIPEELFNRVRDRALKALIPVDPDTNKYYKAKERARHSGRHVQVSGDAITLSPDIVATIQGILREGSVKLSPKECMSMTQFFRGELELNLPDQRDIWTKMRKDNRGLFYRVNPNSIQAVYALRISELDKARQLCAEKKGELLAKKERMKEYVKPQTKDSGGDGLSGWGDEDGLGLIVGNNTESVYF